MVVGPPVPSLTYITKAMLEFVSNHPLIVNTPVYNPETGQQVLIDRYKSFAGLSFDEGLTCSIFPYYPGSDTALSPPQGNRVAAIYEPYNLGENEDFVIYYLVINLQHNSLMVPVDNGNVLTVPTESPIHPSQVSLTSNLTKNVPLIINPSVEILGDYLEILRLVVSDPVHKRYMPIRVKSFEAIYGNLKPGRWETQKNVYFHEAELLVRLDGFIGRGWRDKFLLPVNEVNVSLQEQQMINVSLIPTYNGLGVNFKE